MVGPHGTKYSASGGRKRNDRNQRTTFTKFELPLYSKKFFGGVEGNFFKSSHPYVLFFIQKVLQKNISLGNAQTFLDAVNAFTSLSAALALLMGVGEFPF